MCGRYGSLSPVDALKMPLTDLEAFAEQLAEIVKEENARSTSAPTD